jgi:ribonuclease HI
MDDGLDRTWILRCDGGARGNPGPAASGFVLSDPEGREIEARGDYLGTATNNVAEYRALIAGLEAAARHAATPLLVCMDSELVVRQMIGEYRVKNAGLKPLYEQAQRLAARIRPLRFRSVPRAENAAADRLVNQALDRARSAESHG